MQLRFYQNDGAFIGNNTYLPNTVFYDSGVNSLAEPTDPSDRATLQDHLTYTPIALPERFTFSVSFGGIEANEIAALAIYNPFTVGQSENDYWFNNGGNWGIARDQRGGHQFRRFHGGDQCAESYAMRSPFSWVGFAVGARSIAASARPEQRFNSVLHGAFGRRFSFPAKGADSVSRKASSLIAAVWCAGWRRLHRTHRKISPPELFLRAGKMRMNPLPLTNAAKLETQKGMRKSRNTCQRSSLSRVEPEPAVLR